MRWVVWQISEFSVMMKEFSHIFSRSKLHAKGVLLVVEEYEDNGALTA